jgi:hypothetical protein
MGGAARVTTIVGPYGCVMSEASQDRRFKIAGIVLVFACFLFLPVLFYYGIAGALALVFAAAALQQLVALFRPSRYVCWGAGTMVRFRMSRISHLVLGLWLAFVAFTILARFILKLPSSPYFLVGHAGFALLVVAARWRDTGRFFR